MSRVSNNETDIQGGLADAISRSGMDKFWMRKSGAVEKVVHSPWQGSAANRLAAWPLSDWMREHPIETTHLGRCGYQSNSCQRTAGGTALNLIRAQRRAITERSSPKTLRSYAL